MNASTVVALCASLLAAIVSVAVPVWTFRKTLEQERIRWVRDQRGQLYVDMLTEAYAENQWFLKIMTKLELEMIEAEHDAEAAALGESPRQGHRRSQDESRLPDVRLNAMDRARLGSRGALFASREVSFAFNAFQSAMGMPTLLPPKTQMELTRARFKVGELYEVFQETVRNEIGAREIRMPGEPGSAE